MPCLSVRPIRVHHAPVAWFKHFCVTVNPLIPELNPSAQGKLPRFFTGILIFKGLIARRLYNSFGVKGLINNMTHKVQFPENQNEAAASSEETQNPESHVSGNEAKFFEVCVRMHDDVRYSRWVQFLAYGPCN
jgi:hypothetical protein